MLTSIRYMVPIAADSVKSAAPTTNPASEMTTVAGSSTAVQTMAKSEAAGQSIGTQKLTKGSDGEKGTSLARYKVQTQNQTQALGSAVKGGLKDGQEGTHLVEPRVVLSHNDSTIFLTQDSTFTDLCSGQVDVGLVLDRPRHLRSLGATDATETVGAMDEAGEARDTTETQVVGSVGLPCPTPRGTNALDGFVGISMCGALIMMALLVTVRATTSQFFGSLGSMVYNGWNWKRLEHTATGPVWLNLLLLNLLYHVALAVFALESVMLLFPETLRSYAEHFEGWGLLRTTGLLVVGIMVVYAVRYLIDGIVGYAFDNSGQMRHTTLYKLTTCSLIGLMMMPVSIVMPFVSNGAGVMMIKVVLVLSIALTIIRLIWTVKINAHDFSSIFYIILYLCTVELLPLACVTRVAMLMN